MTFLVTKNTGTFKIFSKKIQKLRKAKSRTAGMKKEKIL